jgi:hypothetical protein
LDAVIAEDGYTENSACIGGGEFPCDARVPLLSVEQCVANLELSSCEAPVSELTDCLVTVYDGCWPAPHGCARYLEKPGCMGTIAVPVTAGTVGSHNSCRLRVR